MHASQFKLPLIVALTLAQFPSYAATPLIFLVTGNASTGRPSIEGTTNLPNGTELMATLSRKASSYMAQDKFVVADGRFRSSSFTNRSNALAPGKYALEVSGPITAVQPVANALGRDYSNFSSPLLKHGKFGTTLKYESSLVVPGQSSSAADAAARKEAERDKVAWLQKSCTEIPAIAERATGTRMSQTQRESMTKRCLAEIK